MDYEVKRYRVSPKNYLCISPEEAVSTGITIGEEMVEEITLVRSQGFGYHSYASIRELPQDELKEISISERKENLFENRKEAVRYIAENNVDKTLNLYAVKDVRMVQRSEIGQKEDIPVVDFMEQLKDFGKKDV
jgi:ribosomal protein L29